MTLDQFAVLLQQMVNEGTITEADKVKLIRVRREEYGSPRLRWFGKDEHGYGYFSAPRG